MVGSQTSAPFAAPTIPLQWLLWSAAASRRARVKCRLPIMVFCSWMNFLNFQGKMAAGADSVALGEAQIGIPTLRDGASGDRFARTIAFDGGLAAAGSWGDDDLGAASGSAYVFAVRCLGILSADLNNDGVLDNGDIGAFVNLFLAGDPSADFTNDGILDNGDIGAFVAAFLVGC